MTLISAVNSVPMRAVLDELPAAANARIVEGRMTIPFGLWPVEIVNEDGEPERVLQRLDKPVAERLIRSFNGLLGRISRFVGGSPIYLGHPDYRKAAAANAAAGEAVPWNVLGKSIGMSLAENALVVEGDFSPAAKALIAANAALAPSPHWGLKRTGEQQEGVAICEPVAFYSMGLTPRPNIAGAAINEDAAVPIDPMAISARDEMIANMSAELSDLDSRCGEACAERDQAMTKVAALTTALAEKDARCKALEADMVAMRAEMDALRKALADQQALAVANERGAHELRVAVVAAAANCGLILAADRDVWIAKLSALAAVNELLDPTRMLKRESIVGQARIAAANADLGGVTPSVRFEQVVRERMNKTGEDWPTAWNACRNSHRELFNLMPNGGKA